MNTDPLKEFKDNIEKRVASYKNNKPLMDAAENFLEEIVKAQNAYNFHWMGVPVIQIPQDLMVMQEMIWDIKPDYIVETGIAHGGSLIFYASMLQLIGHGKVIGIDIDIREHNRIEIEKHPMSDRIEMIEGSSIDTEIADKVKAIVGENKKVIVCLDSNHTHAHVLEELKLYTPLVSKDSYCVVYDTGIEDLEPDTITDRPWGKGNSPKSAIWEFLKTNDNFIIDKSIDTKILITASLDGFLKRIK